MPTRPTSKPLWLTRWPTLVFAVKKLLKRLKWPELRDLALRLKYDPIPAPVASNPQREHRDPQQHHQQGKKRAKPSTHALQHEAE